MKLKRNQDITNFTFGRLSVLEIIDQKHAKNSKWSCKCSCGKIVLVRRDCLLNGTTQSCGCYQKDQLRKNWMLDEGEAAFNHLYSTYKREANKRNLNFCLTKIDFKLLTKQDCYYCGEKPHQIINIKDCNGQYIYNGIDRVDNNDWYNVKNCVPCCKICNRMKRDTTVEDFLLKIKIIHERFL